MLVKKSHLKAAGLCASDDVTRPGMQGANVYANGTVIASDGHVLIKIVPTETPDASEYPKIDDNLIDFTPEKSVLIPTEAIKSLPGIKPKAKLPILEYAQLCKNWSVQIASTNLTSTAICRVDEDSLPPDFEQVIPAADTKFHHVVGIDAHSLITICQAMIAQSTNKKCLLKLEFQENNFAPVKITEVNNEQTTALIMPFNLEKYERG